MSKTTLVIYKILVFTMVILIASGSVALVILSQRMTPASTIELIEEKLNVDVELLSQTEPEGEGYGELKLRIGEFSGCLTTLKDGRVSKQSVRWLIEAYEDGELAPYGWPERKAAADRYTAWEVLDALHHEAGWHFAGRIEKNQSEGLSLVLYVLDDSFPIDEQIFQIPLWRDPGKASLEDAYMTSEDVEFWARFFLRFRQGL